MRSDDVVSALFGTPVDFTGHSGGATAIVDDPSYAVLGVRRALQFKILDQAIVDISAAQDGSAMVNLPQQDSLGIRVRTRFGFAIANPVTPLNADEATRFPFAVIDSAA